MNENKSIIQWLLSKFSTGKNFAFWKVTSQGSKFVVPVYKGTISLWMKRIPIFYEDYHLTILQYGHFVFWKGTLQGSNYRGTVYTGVIPPRAIKLFGTDFLFRRLIPKKKMAPYRLLMHLQFGNYMFRDFQKVGCSIVFLITRFWFITQKFEKP